MKRFLVLAAILPLMLVFFVQFSIDRINFSRIGILLDLVYTAKEEAKQEGCFTQQIRSELTAYHVKQIRPCSVVRLFWEGPDLFRLPFFSLTGAARTAVYEWVDQ